MAETQNKYFEISFLIFLHKAILKRDIMSRKFKIPQEFSSDRIVS